jgi:hypothetical protein
MTELSNPAFSIAEWSANPFLEPGAYLDDARQLSVSWPLCLDTFSVFLVPAQVSQLDTDGRSVFAFTDLFMPTVGGCHGIRQQCEGKWPLISYATVVASSKTFTEPVRRTSA